MKLTLLALLILAGLALMISSTDGVANPTEASAGSAVPVIVPTAA